MRAILLAAGLCCVTGSLRLQAELLSKALLCFPASTKSVEYDNLAQLRKLRDYGRLRKEYSGAPLERAQATFLKLGISEGSIAEIVSTIGSANFYGLVSGTFSGTEAAKHASEQGFEQRSTNGQNVYCAKNGACVAFLEDSLAAFGEADAIKAMIEARQGIGRRMGGGTEISALLEKADLRAPVIGVARGTELAGIIGDGVPVTFLSPENMAKLLGSVGLFQYSVKLDSRAHLDLHVACQSAIGATAFSQTLSAVKALQSVAKMDWGIPEFDHMDVSSEQNAVHLRVDVNLE